MRSVFLTRPGPPRPVAIACRAGRTPRARRRPPRRARDRRGARRVRRGGRRIGGPRRAAPPSVSAALIVAPERVAAGEVLGVPAEVLARDAHARRPRRRTRSDRRDARRSARAPRRPSAAAGASPVVEDSGAISRKIHGRPCAARPIMMRVGAGVARARRARCSGVSMSPLAITGMRTARLDRARSCRTRPAPTNAQARVRPCTASARDAGVLGDARDRAPRCACRDRAGADLERHRHVDRAHDGVDDRRDQRLVGEQRRAGGRVADLLRRAAHVDVDDLRAALDVVARGVGHHARDRRRRSARRSARPRPRDRCAAATSRCRTAADSTRPSPTPRSPRRAACTAGGTADR